MMPTHLPPPAPFIHLNAFRGPTLIAAACDVPEAVIYLAKTGKDCAVTRYNSGSLLATATNRNLRHAKDGKTAAALKEVLAGWSPERHALHNPWFRKAVHVMLLVQQRLRLQAAPPGFAGGTISNAGSSIGSSGCNGKGDSSAGSSSSEAGGAAGGEGGRKEVAAATLAAAAAVPPIELWLVLILPFLNRVDFTTHTIQGFDGSAAAATYPDSDFRLEPWSHR